MTSRNGGRNRDERFKPLYQKYYWRIVRFFERIFRLSREDAEELAQDTFIRFYEAIDEYRGDAEHAYLESIARNVALNRIRARNTQKRNAKLVDIDDPALVGKEPVAPEEKDYGEREEEANRRKRMYEAIAELPQGVQECQRLRLAELKYAEIAQALRISEDAVKSRLRDAKRLLRTRLGEDAVLPEEEP